MNDRCARRPSSAPIGLSFLVLLAGCDVPPALLPPPPNGRISVVLDYAPTSLGLRNSGALALGELMLWDRSSGTLTDVGVEVQLQIVSEGKPTNLEASTEGEIKLRSGFTLTDSAKAEAELAISQNLKFTVTEAVRQTTSRADRAVGAAFRAQAANVEDDMVSWRIDEVLTAPDRFAYVILTDPVLARSEAIAFKSDNSSLAELTITDAVQGQITLSLPKNANASCAAASQQLVPCFIGAKALKPVRRADGSIVFQLIDAPPAAIAAALRAR